MDLITELNDSSLLEIIKNPISPNKIDNNNKKLKFKNKNLYNKYINCSICESKLNQYKNEYSNLTEKCKTSYYLPYELNNGDISIFEEFNLKYFGFYPFDNLQ